MIALIAALSKNRVIGKEGRIPWKIKGEQRRFKELTTGNYRQPLGSSEIHKVTGIRIAWAENLLLPKIYTCIYILKLIV